MSGPDRVFRSLVRDLRRSLERYRAVSLRSIPGQYARAARLHVGMQPPPVPTKRPERLVVTLSTIPSRVRHLRPVLNSLLDQSEPADRIVLALPEFSLREQIAYPAPETLGLPGGIDILRCADMGPATKLLPTLATEPNAALIVVDDDVVYPRDFLATLLAAHQQRRTAALAYRGVRLQPGMAFVDLEHCFATAIREAVAVDIVFGTWGYLLPPGSLGAGAALPGDPADLRWVDDVWVSGHLARRGVERLVVPATAIPIETANAARRSLAGGHNRSGLNDQKAIEAFAAYW